MFLSFLVWSWRGSVSIPRKDLKHQPAIDQETEIMNMLLSAVCDAMTRN
jgi:hypothetical protein